MKSTIIAASAFAAAAISAQAATTAINFSHNTYPGNTGIGSGENTVALNTVAGLDNPVWTNAPINGTGGSAAGSLVVSGLSINWNARNPWSAGSEGVTSADDASQQVFRMYLDDGDANDGTNTTVYDTSDGYGASIGISGLSAYMAAGSATSYTVTLFLSTDSTGFTQSEIRSGSLDGSNAINSLSLLGSPMTAVLGDGTQPVPSGAQTNTQGTRGYATLTGLTDDAIVIAIPTADSNNRGSISGFAITIVPEPSSAALLGLGGLALILRRRK